MSRYYQRPENALKKANEFIDVGKPTRALDALYEVIKNRRNRVNTYSEKILEPIMLQYLSLCVDLKKPYVAKEGLYQYKAMVQLTNVASLETVVRKYLKLSEEKTEAARLKSKSNVEEIDDLDNLATPEGLLLSAVSGEDAQDRTDRAILTPWVKFLWESYRQCLDLLRTNARVEKLYHEVAQQGFKFCLKYGRKTEFRKLCDNLRQHLTHIIKQQQHGGQSPQAINLSSPESLGANLETRLAQLDAAIVMELWQEAYKAIEDIHGLMILSSRKLAKPHILANYYQKLALVFSKAGNFLFHAAALLKLFLLSKEQKKNLTKEESARMACQVLVAVLCSPLPTAHPEFDRFVETEKDAMDKTMRLATLLGLTVPPTRASLIKDLSRLNVVSCVPPQLQDLYQRLEVDFDPLHLCEHVQQTINYIQSTDSMKNLVQYIPPLKKLTLTRLLKEIGQVYQTIEFTRLVEIAKFTTPFDLERIIVNAARHIDMQVRIDQRTHSLHFGTDLTESTREDVSEGPTLQLMPSEQIRTHLIEMSNIVNAASRSVDPQHIKDRNAKLRKQIHHSYHLTAQREHQKILERQKLIEDKKEYLETISHKREMEERKAIEETQKAARVAEERRLTIEAAEREKRRRENELKTVQQRIARDRIEALSQTPIGQKIIAKIDEDDLHKMNVDELMAKQVEELEKQRLEQQQLLKSQSKKLDHLERAKRLAEVPLLEEHYEKTKVEAKSAWETRENERIAKLLEERKNNIHHRDRFMRMKDDFNEFVAILDKSRTETYKEKMKEFESTLSVERKKRLAERKEKRKVERKQKWIIQQEEEKDREEKEKERKIREKEEKEKEEKRKAEEKIEKERQAKLDKIAEKQRQKEKEIEEKLKGSKQESAPESAADTGKWRPSGGGGGWREREQAKKEQWNAPARDDDRRLKSPDREPRDSWRGKETRDSPGLGGGGGWRERQAERDRHGEKDKDDFRRGPPGRDASPRGFGRDDRRPPPRDDRWSRDRDDDRRPPPRDFRDDDRGPRDRFDRGPRDRDLSPPRRGPPPRDLSPRRGSPPRRGPPRDLSPRRGSPPRRGPPRDLSPRRGSPPRRGPPRDLSPRRGSPPRRGPPRDLSPRRGSPPRRGPPPRDRDLSPRGGRGPPPRDLSPRGRGPPRDLSPRRGPPRDEKPWGRDRFDDDRRGPPPPRDRDDADSWRRGGGGGGPPADSWRNSPRDAPPSRGGRDEPPKGRDDPPKDRERDRKGDDDGWAKVVKKK